MAKKYIKSHSNYILRSNPSPTKKGYVYENDLPTTLQKYNSVNGSMVTSTDGGFTFVINKTPDDGKTYNTEGWGEKTYTLNDLDLLNSDFKSVNNSDVKSTINKQKYVKLNKTYTDLSDYCYFGSSNAMLKAAIDDVILNFPAALYLTSKTGLITTGNILTMLIISTDISGYIENNFFIDLFDYQPEERLNLPYDLRTMASSYMDYEIVAQDETLVGYVTGFTGYTSTVTDRISFGLSNIASYTGDTLLIRPIKSKRDEFFDNLDDFQSLLLNQYSVPKYRSSFKIPKESENGVRYEYKNFIWSTTDGYNIDINSSNYSMFISDLIDATNFIDATYNDNLYRILTHDTIKNLDSTYSNEIDEEKLEEIIIGGTKIQKLLRLYGRSFDELKKYIEGISYSNSITYDGLNSLPKEYLSGRLNTSGWDVFSLLNELNKTETTIPGLFPSTSKSYSIDEVNDQLIRNLIINSNNIFKSKGTKKSIRKLFGLLGIDESWYETREYVQVVDNFITGSTLGEIASLNYLIYPENYTTSDGKQDYSYAYDETLFDNTNVDTFIRCPYCGSEDYFISGDTINLLPDINNYVIDPMPTPTMWNYFDTGYYLETGVTYTFQCEADSLIGNITGYTVQVYDVKNNSGSTCNAVFKIGETNSLTFTSPTGTNYYTILIYAGVGGSTEDKSILIKKVKLETGSTATSMYSDSDMGVCIDNNSHKFSLTYSMIGYPKSWNSSDYYFQQKGNWYRETGGKHTNISGLTYVNEISYGNNPHIGDGEYDNGYDYIDQFGDLFKRFIRNSGNSNVPPVSDYTNKGFGLTTKKLVDNKKLSYYDNYFSTGNTKGRLNLNLKNFVIGFNGDKILQSFFNNNNSISTIKNDAGGTQTIQLDLIFYDNLINKDYIQIINISGSTTINMLGIPTGTTIKIHNSIFGNGNDITVHTPVVTEHILSGETIIIKRLSTNEYSTNKYNGEDEFNILKSISLPYLEQLIPSTAIFDFVLIDNESPKWLLVDEYCERDANGNFTGNKVLEYQNVNYFDSVTNYPNDSLTGPTGVIINDFGTGYTYSGSVVKNGQNGSNGFDNIYLFKKPNQDCGMNTDGIWVVDSEIIGINEP